MFNRVLNKRLEIDNNQHCITPFHANVPFPYPFSGGREMEHWREKG